VGTSPTIKEIAKKEIAKKEIAKNGEKVRRKALTLF
jgi:hypothetical protein